MARLVLPIQNALLHGLFGCPRALARTPDCCAYPGPARKVSTCPVPCVELLNVLNSLQEHGPSSASAVKKAPGALRTAGGFSHWLVGFLPPSFLFPLVLTSCHSALNKKGAKAEGGAVSQTAPPRAGLLSFLDKTTYHVDLDGSWPGWGLCCAL